MIYNFSNNFYRNILKIETVAFFVFQVKTHSFFFGFNGTELTCVSKYYHKN